MGWAKVVKQVTPHIVLIENSEGYGTGFLCFYTENKKLYGIATASHVVFNEKTNQPIYPCLLSNLHTGTQILLTKKNSIIAPKPELDSAIIFCKRDSLKLPDKELPLISLNHALSVGSEVAWLGYPCLLPHKTLCFFSGHISARVREMKSYLIDGVAIHGVSGGPVIHLDRTGKIQLVGSVTEYWLNKKKENSFPGLLLSQDVTHFQKVISEVQTIEELISKEKPGN